MPFKSKRQQRAAFGGHIPGISKEKAKEWADKTPNMKKLPDRASGEKGKPTLLTKKSSAAEAGVNIVRRLGRKPVRRGIKKVHGFNKKHHVYEGARDVAGGVYDKLKHSHFMKIADLLMGMGTGAGQLGGQPSSSDKSVFDVPVNSTSARGTGFQTPPRPKMPGASIKKQAVNPRKNLRDAMSQGIA